MRKIMKINKGILLLLALVIGVALLYGPHMLRADGDDGLSARMYWQQKFQYYSGTASEALSVGQTLSMNRIDGTITKADADAGVSQYVIGLAGNTAAKGGTVQVVTAGILAGIAVPAGNNSGMTPYGFPVYVSTAAGGLTVYNVANAHTSGVTLTVGTVLPMSEYAVQAGVTRGSDRIYVNVPFASGISPWNL